MTKKIFTLIFDDKRLLITFMGIVICVIAIIGLLVTAGIIFM